MEIIKKIFLENKAWAADRLNIDKNYFNKLASIQEPDFLWVGCSDSRVPANEITNTEPGEMFVHRNIANVVDLNDINFMSVLHYAVEYLRVKHVIVCGHYGCGGIKAALSQNSFREMDIWLSKIKQVYKQNETYLNTLSEEERCNKMVELNVKSGVEKIRNDSFVKNFPEVKVYGWVYDLKDGILQSLYEENSEDAGSSSDMTTSQAF